MKIAIDVSPIRDEKRPQHRVRGTGFYIKNLTKSLRQHFPQHKYILFTKGDTLPKDIDVVHYPYFEPFFLTLPYFKTQRTIVTVHDLTPLVLPSTLPKGIKGKIKWEIQKRLLGKMDAIITDSICSKKDIIKHAGIPEDKVCVVYLAAGEEFRKISISKKREEELRKKYKLPQKYALYVGDATRNKNLLRLINASLKTKIPLVMVGNALVSQDFDSSNPWNKDLSEIQRFSRIHKDLILPGFVPTEELVKLYIMATVFIMPSLYEGFGLPLLEAMACGCPVITTRYGSIPEVVHDSAYYVDAYDEDNIAKGLSSVFKNTKLREGLSSKGLERVKKFDWKTTAQRTIEVYEKII